MGKKSSSLWSLGEPLFLGLSCVVGGEQFYLLLYGTGRSARGQSFVLVFTAIITCILSAAVSSRTDILAHFFHLFYMSVLLLLIAIANEITSRSIVTTAIIALGYGMTMLVIQSCSLYSRSREELLSFILGLFSARYLPCFLRLFVVKKCTCDSKIRKLSMALGISRLVFCIISLVLKVIMGRFQLTIIVSLKFKNIPVSSGSEGGEQQSIGNDSGIVKWFKDIWEKWSNLPNDMPKLSSEITNIPEKSLKQGFEQIWDYRKYIYSKSDFDDHLEDYDEGYDLYDLFDYIVAKLILFSKPFSKPMPIVLFLTSVLIFLMYPKTSFSAYCSYSPKVISIMMNVKSALHIIGSLVGIRYPASVTSNSALFATITFFFYFLLTLYFFLPYSDKYFKKKFIYSIVGVSSFVLGYLWSYSLGVLINMVLKETCIYEEVETFEIKEEEFHNLKIGKKKTCCGNKITTQCHCKLEERFNFLDIKYKGKTFVCSTLFAYDDRYLSYRYSKYGKCAIFLIYNGEGTDCCEECQDCCTEGCKDNCCLKIIGKYKVEAVTVSSCEDCQLTIRVEGSCCDSDKCPECCGSGGACACKTKDGKCCCICVKCCTPSCSGVNGCCCIHFCKKRECNCECNKIEAKDARLFICYKTNGEKKSCIKEIRPNDKADFVGDLNNKKVFDIDDIFISNCCHVDVRVDLKCTVKNNYFRLGGANYPQKFEKPDIVRLFWSESICCPTKPQCCCMFSRLVRGCVMFTGEEVKCGIIKKCNITCNCDNGSKCCITPCDLIVDDSGGFVKRVDRIRVKLVVISWLFFGLVFFFVVLFASMFRSKYSPVTFYPMTSYSKLAGTFVKNKYNTDEQVTARILTLSVKGQITSQTVEAKKVELKAMLRMFTKYTTKQETKKTKKRKPKEVEKIHKYITSKATSFSPSSSIGGRACELCVIEWSQCVGLVYKYAMPLFLFIRKFFFYWEEAWEIDFYNYEKEIMPYVKKVTHNSCISLPTVKSEVNVGDKSNEVGLNRLITWSGAFKETKQLSQVKMKEDNMINESVPPKVGNRLCYYVRSWNHRLDNIRNWCKFESHLFDWAKFLNEYYKIREWVTDVSPGLRYES